MAHPRTSDARFGVLKGGPPPTKTPALLIVSVVLGLAACSGPSHLPAPWELPGAAVSSAFENATYGAKRGRVERIVSANRDAIAAEIDAGGGVALDQAMAAAGVPDAVRPALVSELRTHPEIYREGRGLQIEPVIVALMVHGN